MGTTADGDDTTAMNGDDVSSRSPDLELGSGGDGGRALVEFGSNNWRRQPRSATGQIRAGMKRRWWWLLEARGHVDGKSAATTPFRGRIRDSSGSTPTTGEGRCHTTTVAAATDGGLNNDSGDGWSGLPQRHTICRCWRSKLMAVVLGADGGGKECGRREHPVWSPRLASQFGLAKFGLPDGLAIRLARLLELFFGP
uniref:Uncharacterized protein n=1 Tax=Oryza punctata TaxID=4537 RepID=A0A0E0L2M3_ORYPU